MTSLGGKLEITSIFFVFFLRRRDVLWRILVDKYFKKTFVGENLGKKSAETFKIENYLICDAPSPMFLWRRKRWKISSSNRTKLRDAVLLGLLAYWIKDFCRCQNLYGFDGLLMTQSSVFYVLGRLIFSHFFSSRQKVTWRSFAK